MCLARQLILTALLLTAGWQRTARADWSMLGANPQRTSWVADEVRGQIGPVWYRPIEPFINYKVQVIAADDKVFVSTARGLYCFHADTGQLLWVHPTEVPLGHSPTYFEGKLYVGSYDRTIHCLDAKSGVAVAGWTPYVAMGGFETNPLVAKTAHGVRVYAGSRDGYFYALDGATGKLAWRYRTGAAIRNSAAMDSAGTIFFASEDLHAYALKDQGGQALEVWRSSKLLGDTFSTFWPVVYRDWVIFSGGMGYFALPPYGQTGDQMPWEEKDEINADLTAATGNEPGDWAAGTVTMDASPILQYFESKPYRRRVFLLNRLDGKEYTFDSDGDGKPEYAPFTFTGITQSGAKYPPVVGKDGVLYTDIATVATASQWTPSGALCGWKVGTKFVSRVMDWGAKQQQAADEPMAFSMGGNVAYWVLCCDREAGAFDVSIPFGKANRWWSYWGYNGRFSLFPGYQPMYPNDDMDGWGIFGGEQGIYMKHGSSQNPWVPYRGKLFHHMGNAVLAVAPGGKASAPLPLAKVEASKDTVATPLAGDLKQRLEEEVGKMIAAGHLKPALFKSNIGDIILAGNNPGGTSLDLDHGTDYFSNPADTVVTLVRALPHLSPGLQQKTKDYLFGTYVKDTAPFGLHTVTHVGYSEGTDRQAATHPPDRVPSFGKQTTVTNNAPWHFPLPSFYAAWKAAQVWPGEAAGLYARMRDKITVPCPFSDTRLVESPQMMNAFLAGYRGYLELEKLAGKAESTKVRAEHDRLLGLRVASFSVDSPTKTAETGGANYGREIFFSRHFIYLVPEVAEELAKTKLSAMQTMMQRIQQLEPYWFVGGYDTTYYEGTHHNLYETTIFGGLAKILKPPYKELVKWLDAPVFPVGDLFYISNLVAAIEAAGAGDQGHVNPDGGGTPSEAGVPTDGGMGSGGEAKAGRPSEGCGCNVTPSSIPSWPLLSLLLLHPRVRARRPGRRRPDRLSDTRTRGAARARPSAAGR